MFSIGSCSGSPLKVDDNTFWTPRGKYARLCVEIDFNKPLTSKIMVEENMLNIEYENFSAICFSRGRIGHKEIDCPIGKKVDW